MSYSQNDPQWKNVKIGFDTGPSDTIGNYGCYMTAIANVCKWAGNDLTPFQINDLCKQNGWLVQMDSIARDDIPALLCNNLTYVGRTNWTDAVSMNFFDDASDPNVAYIIKIDASHAPGLQSHFVMVWAKLGDNDLEIDDSWDGVRKPLSSYGNPSVVIYSAMKFVKTAPVAPAPPVVAAPVPEPAPVPPPPPQPPAAPIPFPSAEKYTTVTLLKTFLNAADAMSGQKPQTTLAKGTYFVYSKNGKAYNLSVDNMKEGVWVNTLDNIPPMPKPVLQPDPVYKPSEVPIGEANNDRWKATYTSFYPDRRSVTYQLNQTVSMKEYSGKRNMVVLEKGAKINIIGTFVKNGVTFYRPRANNDEYFEWYFGIPQTDDAGNALLVKVANNQLEVPERLGDFLHMWRDDLKQIWDIYVHRSNKKG